MKNNSKFLVLTLVICAALCLLVACNNDTNKENVNVQQTETQNVNNNIQEPVNEVVDVNGGEEEVSGEEFVDVPKNQQIGTAGSNIPLKDNNEEAELQIKRAMQDWLKETYGDEVFDARIYVEKIYSAEDEQEVEALKEMNLGPDEVAFEVKYELKPAAGVEDIMKFTAATGEYDEESGWVKEKYNLGVLRPNPEGEPEYIITDFGTGW